MNGADHDDQGPAASQFTIGGRAATLVVRAWLEPVAGGAPVLRGTVAALGGRMLGAFDSLESLAALVDRHVAAPPDQPDPDQPDPDQPE
ncbi:MAG: hypothetical protein WC804_11750 [Sphingomonas sp.]|jgi:hypothetical protein|uniref:hypothetical protein n=1 Tax=Sphingomonas sp. TaxID=28214 RepID=UPI003564B228